MLNLTVHDSGSLSYCFTASQDSVLHQHLLKTIFVLKNNVIPSEEWEAMTDEELAHSFTQKVWFITGTSIKTLFYILRKVYMLLKNRKYINQEKPITF